MRHEVRRVIQLWQSCARGYGLNDLGGDYHDELRVGLRLRDGIKELAEDRNISDEGNLLEGFSFSIVEQPTNGEALAFAEFNLGLHFSYVDGGHLKTGYLHAIGEVERADFWSDLQMDGSARSDGGNEVETDSKFLELNRDGGSRTGSLYHGIGIFASGEEAALLAVLREHVGLSEDLHKTFAFEGLNGSAKIEARKEGEKVKLVRQSRRRRSPTAGKAQAWRRKLPGGNTANGVAEAGAENVDPELIAHGAVDTCKDHLEENLRLRGGHFDIEQVDHFSGDGGDLDGTVGAGEILCGAAEEDGTIVRADLEVLAWELFAEFAAYGIEAVVGTGEAGAHCDGEQLAIAAPLPKDQAGFCWSFSVDQNLIAADRGGLSKAAQSDGYPLDGLRTIE